jgi:hypothetical protein
MTETLLTFLNNNSDAITAMSILVAGLIWILKLPYDKYQKEIVSISKLEKLFALNEASLRDNIQFMKEWQESITASRPYNCHFEPLIIEDINNLYISDIKLVNKILKINYMMKRSGDDLNNLYKSYWEILNKISSIPDPAERERNFTKYHETISVALKAIKEGAETVYGKIIPVLAHLQIAGDVRFHSIFGYIKYILLADIYPRPTQKRIQSKIEFLESDKGKSALE